MATLTAGQSATIGLDAWATLSLVVSGKATLAFTSGAENVQPSFDVTNATSRDFGPYGCPMSVVITAVDRSLTYTVTGGVGGYQYDSSGNVTGLVGPGGASVPMSGPSLIGAAVTDGDFARYAARSEEPTPTIYFDPTATGSAGTGTLANPYYTVAQVVAAFTGSMPGTILGVKRGTTVRTEGAMVLNVYGSSVALAEICAYGDAEALPIFNGANITSTWTQYGSDPLIWYISSASSQEVYYDGSRLQGYSSLANLQAASSGRFWDSGASRIYIKPPSGESPNLGQVEVTAGSHALNIQYTNVAASGFIAVRDIHCKNARNSCLVIEPPSSAGTISTVTSIQVNGCKFTGAGVDGVSSLGSDGVVVYGVSDSIRATGVRVASCEARELLNNSVEIAFATSPLVEGNYANVCGGNVWAEFWASVSGGICRYNRGFNASNSGRLTTSYHAGAFWSTIWTAAGGSSPDHTKNVNLQVYGNLGVELQTQGIEIYGGTGHVVYNNTLINCSNRGINMFTNVATAGTCSAAVNNNIVVAKSGGNHIPIDIIQGTATNSGGVSITSTLTGDNNLYYRSNGGAMNFRTNGSSTTTFSTYKAAASPFDANALNSSPLLDQNYRPRYGSPAVNGGASVATWLQDGDGLPLLGSIGIGCYQMPRWNTRVLIADNR